MTVSLFAAGDAAVLLIDHQVGNLGRVRSTDLDEIAGFTNDVCAALGMRR